MNSPFYLNLVQQTLQQTTTVMPTTFTLNVDYDLIHFEDGYEKPTKDVFYTKYNELLRNIRLEKLRSLRNEKLQQSDFTMLSDKQLSLENETEWMEYRQALRDIPSTTEDPENPLWPEPPKVKITTSGSTTKADLQAEKVKTKNLEALVLTLISRVQKLETR